MGAARRGGVARRRVVCKARGGERRCRCWIGSRTIRRRVGLGIALVLVIKVGKMVRIVRWESRCCSGRGRHFSAVVVAVSRPSNSCVECVNGKGTKERLNLGKMGGFAEGGGLGHLLSAARNSGSRFDHHQQAPKKKTSGRLRKMSPARPAKKRIDAIQRS